MDPQTAAQPSLLGMMFPFVLMFMVIYFLILRPQQKRQRTHAELIKNLKKGDKVVTAGGIIGVVHTLQDDYVVIKVGDQSTKLEILRSSIQEVRK